MQEGGWLPAFIVPAATSPTTMPVGSHAAGDSRTARHHRSRDREEPTPGVPSTSRPQQCEQDSPQTSAPREPQLHRTPTTCTHSVPQEPDPTEPRPRKKPSPSPAQPSPKSPRSSYLGTDGAAAQGAAGAAHGAPAGPAQPRGAGRGIPRRAAPLRDGTG